jgi:DNA-directed RNA polymerase subunit omega
MVEEKVGINAICCGQSSGVNSGSALIAASLVAVIRLWYTCTDSQHLQEHALSWAGQPRLIRISGWRRAGGLKAAMSKNTLLSMALSRVQSRFLLVNLLTKRIRELKDGSTPLIPRSNNLAVEDIALQEIAEGKITPHSIADYQLD